MSELELSRMRDSSFSEALFLGETESLLDLIQNDSAVLDANDINWKELANAIDGVISFCEALPHFMGQYTVLSNTLQVTSTIAFRIAVEQHLGYQYCPFEKCCCAPASFHGKRVGDTIATLEKVVDGTVVERIKIASLLSHLCSEHKFLEGQKCEFRIDPQRFIDFFDLKCEKQKQATGTILKSWLSDKVTREDLMLKVLVDPIPDWMKMFEGRAELRYSC